MDDTQSLTRPQVSVVTYSDTGTGIPRIFVGDKVVRVKLGKSHKGWRDTPCRQVGSRFGFLTLVEIVQREREGWELVWVRIMTVKIENLCRLQLSLEFRQIDEIMEG